MRVAARGQGEDEEGGENGAAFHGEPPVLGSVYTVGFAHGYPRVQAADGRLKT
jgi:hypothetical protein